MTETLIDLYNSKRTNQISGFCDVIQQLNANMLRDKYCDLVKSAPRRHLRNKRYIERREGISSSGTYSNRYEEHLALALYNHSRTGTDLTLPNGDILNLVDYQTPLKSKCSDKGFGKVDLLGVIAEKYLSVIELKVRPMKKRYGDTPLRAFLEGLAYCAIVEANAQDIGKEIAEKFEYQIEPSHPTIIIMAPIDYWNGYLDHRKTGPWWSEITELANYLSQELQIKTYFLGLRNAKFEMGLDGQAAQLTGEVSIVSVLSLYSDAINQRQ